MHVLRAFMASWAHLMFAVTSVKEDWHLDWSESKVTSQTVRHCARVTANPLLQDTITIAEAAKRGNGPTKLTGARSCQFGRASAPIAPQIVLLRFGICAEVICSTDQVPSTNSAAPHWWPMPCHSCGCQTAACSPCVPPIPPRRR